MKHIGIDIGSTSVKVVLLEGGRESWHETVAHEGAIPATLLDILDRRGVDGGPGAVVTGNAGRQQVRCAQAIPPLAIEAGLRALDLRADAVVCLGGESLAVYTLASDGRIQNTLTGDKCAAGTGEFFRQQLGRMDLSLDCLADIPADTACHPLSARCSVFMKSDCTHKLNKKEATKQEIVVSLAEVMAGKAAEFLTRARLTRGRVVLVGGVTSNRFLLRSLERKLPEAEFVIPAEAAYFEAYGAAHLAAEHGAPLPRREELMQSGAVCFERYPPLEEAATRVACLPARRGRLRPDGEYLLGIDGGSTTTKAVLVDAETREICAAFYGRTHGDPVEALRTVLREIRAQVRDQIGDAAIRIPLAATTGSSREVLGLFAQTPAVYNEIIAHTAGATHFHPGIDTIFEIGGQDAKYVFVQNGVPIDYAMNEACSAGTGSFIEESARGDLNIQSAPEIGPLALESRAPLKFGEHCSAFINSDIRAAVQQGAAKTDITAGIVFSVVANYLNRVVGNRAIGGSVVLQGGVAKNPAVPAAFAAVLQKEIVVPPDPELLGAFGVALLAAQKRAEGLLEAGDFELDALIARPIRYGQSFTCKACENLCPIRTLIVGERKNAFGGRCNKYANLRKAVDVSGLTDLVALRERLLFEEYAPDPTSLRPRTEKIVGVPRAFTVHSLWPLYAWAFHELGVRVVLSEHSLAEGVQRAEAAYCLPGEIAHGMTAELLARGVDYLFLPQVKNLDSLEPDVQATLCPITQALPYYLRAAFELDDSRLLRPILDFARGEACVAEAFGELAERLGFSREEGRRAFGTGLARQRDFQARLQELGAEVLETSRARGETVIALLGRPYNAFASEANMGIPRKFLTRGFRVLPFDFFPVSDETITPNMYWYYGQLNLKAARLVKDHPNLFLCVISNFSCAPDSFMLHFTRWFMGLKPYLVLELDSHTADAGIDTRIEAFLDIIEGYRLKVAGRREARRGRRYQIELRGARTAVLDRKTGQRLPLRDPRVKLVVPSMGAEATEALTAVARRLGFHAMALPVPDGATTQLARDVASGKECIPTLLVLGQMLKLLASRPPAEDEVLAVLVPKTTGPCRTGQYGPFYEGILDDLGIENVTILPLSSDNGYAELGSAFTVLAWHGLALADLWKDIQTSLGILAVRPEAALAELEADWKRSVELLITDLPGLHRHLRQVAARLRSVPLRGRLEDLKKVLVVGEIYVRRDDYSVGELVEHLSTNGILAKVTGITEWIHYCNHLRDRDLVRAMQGLTGAPGAGRPFRERLTTWAGFRLEQAVQSGVDERLRALLEPSGLVPHCPHDMSRILADVEAFTHLEFETEATISSLVARQAMQEGYDGIAAIAPFACLPGRLIRALFEPYARARDIPFIALENDGLAYPPNTLSRLEIFMLNVLRRGGAAEASDGFHPVAALPRSEARPAPTEPSGPEAPLLPLEPPANLPCSAGGRRPAPPDTASA
jgi:predicted CoA-substrate-specific enzyme activase